MTLLIWQEEDSEGWRRLLRQCKCHSKPIDRLNSRLQKFESLKFRPTPASCVLHPYEEHQSRELAWNVNWSLRTLSRRNHLRGSPVELSGRFRRCHESLFEKKFLIGTYQSQIRNRGPGATGALQRHRIGSHSKRYWPTVELWSKAIFLAMELLLNSGPSKECYGFALW